MVSTEAAPSPVQVSPAQSYLSPIVSGSALKIAVSALIAKSGSFQSLSEAIGSSRLTSSRPQVSPPLPATQAFRAPPSISKEAQCLAASPEVMLKASKLWRRLSDCRPLLAVR